MSKGKHNAAIYLLSSRTSMLKKSLEFLYSNWNNEYDYPVYVHYFDNIYSQEFINNITSTISPKISFHQIDYEVPEHIPEETLFYNRKYLKYVRTSFPPARIGYLHMEHFVNNFHKYGEKGCLIKDLEKYDYLMRIDDDSWFKEKIDFDLFDRVQDVPVATAYSWRHAHWRHEQTTENLWKFYLAYLNIKNIKPESIKNNILREAAMTRSTELTFPQTVEVSCGNLNIYNIKMLLNAGYEDWMNFVNDYGGAYKHRWGDIETIALFTGTMFEYPLRVLGLKEKGLYSPQLPGWTYAPSTLHNEGPSRGKKS